MTTMPTGTVTFLFTDIEGSTRLWETYPDAMRDALSRHDTLLKDTIQGCRGYVFKTVGDAVCAAFHTPMDALDAALKCQLALQAETWGETGPLRVRTVIHTGLAEERDNDYFGQTVNRVARLEALAYGGQIILSQASYELIRDLLPAHIELQSLGTHRLKDLHRAEQIYQAACSGLPTGFPPPKSLESFPNNLPLQLSRFIGRTHEIVEVLSLISSHSLVTLLGTGGTGKTRLSLQAGAEALDQFADGVWFVELASLSEADLVPQAIAAVLGMKEGVGEAQRLVEYLKPRKLLLILDNCEHLVNACARLAQTLLQSCPHVSILASSRESFNISGEQTFRVPPLQMPDSDGKFTVQTLPQYEAVQLFLDRAVIIKPDFQVTNQNAPALAQLCCRLDGIPLAIELAAARIRSLSVEQIEERLKDRFRLLTGGSRMALPRQQTLRALVDWSYDQLKEAEKQLLQGLSIFAGGWTLEAAEQVCAGESLDEWQVLECLTALVDKSLVAFEEQEGSGRYRLLETIHSYSREKLVETGQGHALSLRHRDFFLAMAQEAKGRLQGAEQAAALNQLERDYMNFRAALDFCCEEESSAEIGLRIGTALWSFYQFRGYMADGRRYLTMLLSRPELSGGTEIRSEALLKAGNMALSQGDSDQALALYEESLAIRQAMGYQEGIASSLSCLALAAHAQNDLQRAGQLLEESLMIYRELQDSPGIARTLGNLGMVAQDQGEFATALSLHTQSLALWRELGNERYITIALGNQGYVARKQGDFAQARACFAECLSFCLLQSDVFITPYILEGLAAVFLEEKAPECSVRLYSSAAILRKKAGTSLHATERAEIETTLSRIRVMIGDTLFNAAYQEGQDISLVEAIEYAVQATQTEHERAN